MTRTNNENNLYSHQGHCPTNVTMSLNLHKGNISSAYWLVDENIWGKFKEIPSIITGANMNMIRQTKQQMPVHSSRAIIIILRHKGWLFITLHGEVCSAEFYTVNPSNNLVYSEPLLKKKILNVLDLLLVKTLIPLEQSKDN